MNKVLLLTALFFFCSIGLTFGQTTKGSTQTNLKSTELKSVPVDQLDGYMGYKDQILKRLIVKEIPKSFPSPVSGQTREEYKETMFVWFENNLDMVKNEYHSKFK